MRIWDIPVQKLCRNHLLGEHVELHALFNIITKNKKGFANHPETMRWRGKLKALYKRHDEEVREMLRRGYHHKSPLNKKLATGKSRQTELKDPIKKQIQLLRQRKCKCKV